MKKNNKSAFRKTALRIGYEDQTQSALPMISSLTADPALAHLTATTGISFRAFKAVARAQQYRDNPVVSTLLDQILDLLPDAATSSTPGDYEAAFKLILHLVTPLLSSNPDEELLAICSADRNVLLYTTTGLGDLLATTGTADLTSQIRAAGSTGIISLEQTGHSALPIYLEFRADTRFCESVDNPESSPEGFVIYHFRNITRQHALACLSKLIVEAAKGSAPCYLHGIYAWLQVIAQSKLIRFGLIPVLKVNGEIVFDEHSALDSRLVSAVAENSQMHQEYLEMAASYLADPKTIRIPDLHEENTNSFFISYLKSQAVRSYALLPIYEKEEVIGMLEMSSDFENGLTDPCFENIQETIPMLAQIILFTVARFNARIDRIVSERFTALQPGVEWKFRECAWHIANQSNRNQSHIVFENVFPLYGAVDVRNSTGERNEAFLRDTTFQFEILTGILTAAQQKYRIPLAGNLLFKTEKLLAQLIGEAGSQNEQKIKDFDENEIRPFLKYLQYNYRNEADLMRMTAQYETATNPSGGDAYVNRNRFEASMNTINALIDGQLEKLKATIMHTFPCYFEKFRTDGVEFDIYIGQSIAPKRPFSEILVKNVRLAQLICMVQITKSTNQLAQGVGGYLKTTQLIFAQAGTLDIAFREDEKRFDVEGAYNLRYQIIKKRIDKVFIKNTSERLTQPGKIVIVYFHPKVVPEYEEYIAYLQAKDLLKPDQEYLELEELQGVSGLKALRIEVVV